MVDRLISTAWLVTQCGCKEKNACSDVKNERLTERIFTKFQSSH